MWRYTSNDQVSIDVVVCTRGRPCWRRHCCPRCSLHLVFQVVVVYYTNLQRQNRVPNLFLSSNNIPHPCVISVLKLTLILAVESNFEIMPFLVKVLVCGVAGVGWGGWLTRMSVLFLYRAHSKVSHFDSEALSVVNRFSGTTILMETRRLCVKSRSDIGVSISRAGRAHIANKWGLHERRVYSSEALGKLLTIHTLQT